MAGLPQKPQVLSWILVEHKSEIDPVFCILLDRLDHGGFALERNVHHISTALGSDSDTITGPQLDSINYHTFQAGFWVEEIFVERAYLAHRAVHLYEFIFRQTFRPLQNLSRPLINLAHLPLLFIRHR